VDWSRNILPQDLNLLKMSTFDKNPFILTTSDRNRMKLRPRRPRKSWLLKLGGSKQSWLSRPQKQDDKLPWKQKRRSCRPPRKHLRRK
jgi:hypothetical protein